LEDEEDDDDDDDDDGDGVLKVLELWRVLATNSSSFFLSATQTETKQLMTIQTFIFNNHWN
jgi:hypothetical protein